MKRRALLALILLVPSLACDAGEPTHGPVQAGPVWKAGTVLAVEGVEIDAAAVDAVAAAIGALYPAYTRPHNRRLALTNVVLPRLAVAAQNAGNRDEALAACRGFQEPPAGAAPAAEILTGTWRTLGLEVWLVARELEPGRWSEPVELIGRWGRLRVDEVTSSTSPSYQLWTISLVGFPFVDPNDPAGAISAAIDASRLTLVDPSWSEVVPEGWKRRMQVRGP